MINYYNIKQINNEQVLYLYLDYNYEFANNLGSFNHKMHFFDQIKDYIKKMHINFKGKHIVVVVAGIMALTLTCNSLKYDNENNTFVPDYEMLEIVKYETFPNYDLSKQYISNSSTSNELNNVEVEEIIEEDIPQNEVLVQEITNTQTEANPINKEEKVENINTKEEIKVEATNTKEEIKVEATNTKEEIKVENAQKEIETINKTYVVVYRSNGIVETIELEEYIIGVVAAEMPASFNIEALKAQAIVARTYALKRIEENKVLTDTVSTQVYKDNYQLQTLWGKDYDKYYTKVKSAVEDTKGLVITYDDQLIDAVFHSTSNGYTVDAIDVWGNDIPYLKSVKSPWDLNATSYLRTITKEINDIANTLGITIENNSDITIISKDDNNRVLEVNIAGNLYSGIELRNKLGLRSTDFDIEINDNTITFTTKGYGHGVGMSQYGANGMANEGYNYKQIINHYYQNVNITQK